MTIRFLDGVFVFLSCFQIGNKGFPDAHWVAGHRTLPYLPIVEIADDANSLSVGCPHGKADARFPAHFGKMRPQLFVDALVLAFAKQMTVNLGQPFGCRG